MTPNPKPPSPPSSSSSSSSSPPPFSPSSSSSPSRSSSQDRDRDMEMEMERLNKEEAGEMLPTTEKPVQALPRGPQLHPAFYIAAWIFFSNSTILFNKWILDTLAFRYPAVLTTIHLAFSVLTTQLIARFYPTLIDPKAIRMTGRIYLRNIVPIGILYSFSLVCSNRVYLYLSVAYIQMLKSAAPVVVLGVSWLWGVASPDMRKLINVLVITAGIALTTAGELDFSLLGFAFQLSGTVFEALRIVMIEVLVSGRGGRGGHRQSTRHVDGKGGDGHQQEDQQPAFPKMDPLLTLYYYAPVCMVSNFLVACVFEGGEFTLQELSKVGAVAMFTSAVVAFMLNVASVFLIGRTSAVVQCLTGIFKNVLLVFLSMFLWGTSITLIQWLGYGVALLGLVYYSLGPEGTKDLLLNIRSGAEAYGVSRLVDKLGRTWMIDGRSWWRMDEDVVVSSRMRRRLLCGFLGFIIVMVVVVSMMLLGGSESGFEKLVATGSGDGNNNILPV